MSDTEAPVPANENVAEEIEQTRVLEGFEKLVAGCVHLGESEPIQKSQERVIEKLTATIQRMTEHHERQAKGISEMQPQFRSYSTLMRGMKSDLHYIFEHIRRVRVSLKEEFGLDGKMMEVDDSVPPEGSVTAIPVVEAVNKYDRVPTADEAVDVPPPATDHGAVGVGEVLAEVAQEEKPGEDEEEEEDDDDESPETEEVDAVEG